MNLIQMTHRGTFSHENQYAPIKRALNEEIGKRAFSSALAAE